MIKILYEDSSIIVVDKPAGMESQSSRGFAADVVSELKKHRAAELSTDLSTKRTGVRGKNSRDLGENYIGVIHRLDKPVSGVMVYAKTREAANILSEQVKQHQMEKIYCAVVCGSFVDNVGNYVDNLLKDEKNNCSMIVDKGIKGGKTAQLSYRVVDETVVNGEEWSLVEIHLQTGRHHQIRVQFSGHGHPLWGDNRYNPLWGGTASSACFLPAEKRRGSLALCAVSLSFFHPDTGKRVTFEREPCGQGFSLFERHRGGL